MIPIVHLPDDQPTAYMRGSRTRQVDGSVPHLSMVLPVGQFPMPRNNWRLRRGAAAALASLNAALVELDVEPVRLTDAYRDPATQGALRTGYNLWVKAGRPEPNTGSWEKGMRTAYAAQPGESFHGCGSAIDIDVGALIMPGCNRGSNQALAAFWYLAERLGWTPIISKPSSNQSECWHFDHLGPLKIVRDLFDDVGRLDVKYAGMSYSQTARAGAALAGVLPEPYVADRTVAYIQARLSLGGIFVGKIDGVIGPRTRDGLKQVGITLPTKPKPVTILPELEATGLAAEALAAA